MILPFQNRLIFFIEKYLLALRCLLATFSLSPSDPIGHQQLIRLQHTLAAHTPPLPSKVSEVIKAELESVLPSPNTNLKTFNDDWLEKHKDSAEHVLAGLQARQHLHKASKDANQKEVIVLLGRDETSLTDAVMAVEVVKEWGGDVPKVMEVASKRWPEASAFQEAKTK